MDIFNNILVKSKNFATTEREHEMNKFVKSEIEASINFLMDSLDNLVSNMSDDFKMENEESIKKIYHNVGRIKGFND